MPNTKTTRLAGQVFPLDADGRPVLPPLAGGETNATEERANRLRASAASGVALIARSARQLANLLLDARASIRQIESRKDLTPEAKLQRMEEVRAKLRDEIDALESRVLDSRRRVEGLVSDALERPRGDEQAALVREQRLGRTWDRLRRLLDSGHDALDLTERAGRDGDLVALDALREELPDYLRANAHDESTVAPLLELIDRRARPHLDAEQAAAVEVRDELRDRSGWAEMSVSHARAEATGGPRVDLLFASKADRIDVAGEDAERQHPGVRAA